MTTNEHAPLFSVCSGERHLPAHTIANLEERSYAHHLDGLDVTERQKSDLMLVVWALMRTWVEMDLPIGTCGPIFEALLSPSANETEPAKETENFPTQGEPT